MRLVRRHPVTAFFVLAYVLAWGAIPWNSFFAPGALLAALVVVGITSGTAGLRALGSRLVRWRVAPVWYVLAIGVPAFVFVAAIAVNVSAGAPPPSLSQFSPWYGVVLAWGLNVVDVTGGPLSEEPAFRGFAQASLQTRRTLLQATAVMGLLVAGWHVPLVVLPQFDLRPVDLLTTVAVTFWYGWLFNRASGSALITLLAHSTEGALETSALWPAEDLLTRGGVLTCLLWSAVAVALVVADRRRWTAPASDHAKLQAPALPRTGQAVALAGGPAASPARSQLRPRRR